MKTITYFFQLIRLSNLIIIGITLVLLRYVSSPNPSMDFSYFMAMLLGTILIAAAGNIINDILDLEIDKINKPDRLIIDAYLSKKTALVSYAGFNLIALFLVFGIGDEGLVLFFGSAIVLLYFYSKSWKKQALIGNVVVALLCAWIVIEFWWVERDKLSAYWTFILGSYAAFAFFSTMSRELVKDLEDLEGDKKMGCKTFPIVSGTKAAKQLINLSFFALLILLLMEAYLMYNKAKLLAFSYLLFVLIMPLFYLFYCSQNANNKSEYSNLSKLIKIYMLLGLILLFFV